MIVIVTLDGGAALTITGTGNSGVLSNGSFRFRLAVPGLIGLYLLLYFFNVVGEEFLWRGYLWPKQELTHGKYTWVVHGIQWTCFHLFAPYNALMVLPGALFMSYVVQRLQNNMIFLISHATLNGIPFIMLILNVFGV